MAKLTCHELTLEVRYREFDDCCWVQYDVLFLWKDKPMVDDPILKRSPSGWSQRGKGVLRANEYDGDSLLPVLKRALEENEADYWEPTEPDVILAFYPDQVFPFLPSKWKTVHEAPRMKKERLARERAKKAAGGRLPDDPFTVIAFADAYQWKESHAYAGNGLALVMTARRASVERFYKQLAKEYKAFERKECLQERLREREEAYREADLEYEAKKAAAAQKKPRAVKKRGTRSRATAKRTRLKS